MADEPTTSTEDSPTTPLIPAGNISGNGDKNSTCFKHAFIAVVAALSSVAPGMCLGYSAVTLPQLNFNLDDTSWFASIIFLAIPVGNLISGSIMDKIGRRTTLLIVNFIGFLGWIMLTYNPTAPTLAKLYFGRILTGISVGLASSTAAVYATETFSTNTEFQVSITTWSTIAFCLGILIVYVTGSLIPYSQVAGFAAVMSVISFVAVAIFLPESPSWLQSKGRQGDADWVASKMGSSRPKEESDVEAKSQPSTSASESTIVASESEKGSGKAIKDTFDELKHPEAYRPLLVLICFFLFLQFSGAYVIITYMVDIIRMSGVVAINPYFVTVLAGTIILFVSVFASFTFPKTSLRSVAAISAIGMGTSMLFIAVYLSLRPYFLTRMEYYYLRWIPLLAIFFTITSSAVSFLIPPWCVFSKIFPLPLKGTSLAIATTVGYLFIFALVKTFPYLWMAFGNNGMFYFFAIMCLLNSAFAYFFVPESNGKTLDEIIDNLSKSKNKK